MYKIVSVLMEKSYSNKNYSFYTDLELEVGDKVVCDTVNGLVVGEVKEINVKTPSAKVTKFIVDKIDIKGHQLRLEREEIRKEKELKLAKIKKEMDKEISKTMEMTFYEKYAEKNPEIKKLLEEYKDLMEE
jgi:sporulation protein YlmC with PRC-barrel domain